VLYPAIFEPLVSACALADQIGSTYQRASTNGLSKRTPGVTLDTDELERELGAIEELVLGTELDVVATLELLGATDERELGAIELVVATDELLGATDERELGATELVVATDELLAMLEDPPTTLIQVEREIQLLLFSQPQPLWVLTHSGYKVPYQLHCCPPLLITLELELLRIGVELREELVVGMLDGADELVTVPEQILPVTLGISAAPPRLST
jgi:hypothetical protein